MKAHNLICLFFLASTVLSGCAPKVRIESSTPSSFDRVALLPAVTTGVVSRERLDFFDRSLYAALRSRGYSVLEPALVQCKDSQCSNLAEVAKSYGISQFLKLEVDTASENNFIAGYVNSATGTLRGLTPTGSENFAIEHTASETGGVVFYSGQVIQGIISQIENSNRDPFQQVAEKFVEQVVNALPTSPNVQLKAEHSVPEILAATAMEVAPSTYEVCVKGTAGQSASLKLSQNKVSLSEYPSGEYCGAFLIPPSVPSPTYVELRSPFGSTSRSTVVLRPEMPCTIARMAHGSQDSAGRVTLRFGCEDPHSATCMPPTSCRGVKYHLFAAEKPLSPYRRVAVLQGTEWKGASTATSQPHYELVPVGPLGPLGSPIRVTWASHEEGTR